MNIRDKIHKIRTIVSDLSAVSLRTGEERKQFIEGLKMTLKEVYGVERFYHVVLLIGAALVLGYIIFLVMT